MDARRGKKPDGVPDERRKLLGKNIVVRVADAVLARRMVLGLSQKALAEKAGVDLSTYKRVESAMNAVAIDNLEKIARGLQIEVSGLLK